MGRGSQRGRVVALLFMQQQTHMFNGVHPHQSYCCLVGSGAKKKWSVSYCPPPPPVVAFYGKLRARETQPFHEETGLSVAPESMRLFCFWESVFPTSSEKCLELGQVKAGRSGAPVFGLLSKGSHRLWGEGTWVILNTLKMAGTQNHVLYYASYTGVRLRFDWIAP